MSKEPVGNFKEDYYSVIVILVIRLAKLDNTNEEFFENIIYLLYLITLNY